MLSTKNAFELIKLLNDMKIKDSLIKTIRTVSKLEKKKKTTFQKLFKLKKEDEEITDETVTRLLTENIDIAKEIAELDGKNEEITMYLVADFIFGLSNCEETFYKTMSKIREKEIEDIKNEDVTVIIKDLIDEITTNEFLGFFKSLMK